MDKISFEPWNMEITFPLTKYINRISNVNQNIEISIYIKTYYFRLNLYSIKVFDIKMYIR